jgi:murein DD-endopeptidase MepM/ murein hydrolase activator NlpD
MAIPTSVLRPQTEGIYTARESIRQIAKDTSATQISVDSISRIIKGGTKEKTALAKRSRLFKNRREEAKRRGANEAKIEASSIKPGNLIPGQKVMANAGGSFIDRILGFIGWTSLGWLIQNLPTWIQKGEEFLERVNFVHNVLKDMPNRIFNVFGDFGNILKGLIENASKFDFLDESGKVRNATEELKESFDKLKTDLEDAFAVVTGQPIPEREEEPSPGGGSPSPGGGSTYTSTGGEKLDPANRDYGEYRPGAFGTRGKSRVHGKGGERGHTGEDFPLPEGTPITLVSNGTVVDVGIMGDSRDPDGTNGGYGNFVVIQLEDGTFVKLAHMKSISVKKGDKVGAGTGSDGNAKVVGFSGSTGLSTGPHLHLDHATGYNPASASVSGTMDPMGLVDAGLIVKGGNVKATKTVSEPDPPQPQSQPSGPSIPDVLNEWWRRTQENLGITDPQTSAKPQTPVLPSSGRYNLAQLIQLSKSVGFNDDQAIKMAAIAMAESGGDPRNDTIKSGLYKQSGETSYGLWQINMTGPYRQERLGWFGINSVDKLYDPITNAKAAKIVYDKQGFGAWSVYGGQEYEGYLKDSRSVAPSILSSSNQNTEANKIASVTEERKGQTVVVNNSQSQPQLSQPSQGSSPDNSTSYSGDVAMLNSVIKQKILLELSYV